jgi:Flp pilus assembly protein TadD
MRAIVKEMARGAAVAGGVLALIVTPAAQAQGATKEALYTFAEIEAARGKTAEATSWYQKASASDPNWGKPLLKLGLSAMQRGDRANAATLMQRVVAVDPMSAEAAQAKTVIDQLR